MDPHIDAREERLARTWLSAQGVESAPDLGVHPSDDMYRDDVLGLSLERRTFEYLRSGREALNVLRHVLRLTGKEEPSSLLEFACGYGRLLRWLVLDHAAESIHASDVLRPAVDFVGERFGVQGFYSEADADAIPLERSFEVIWVGSLFSHLPRHRFEPMLARLIAALEPNGVLIFTTHAIDGLPEEERGDGSFVFRNESESHILDLAEYGSTFASPKLVADIAHDCGAKTHACIERGVWRIQDVHVVSPAASGSLPGLDPIGPAPFLRGSISKVEVTERNTLWIDGWVRVPREFGAIRQLTLVIDGELEVEALFRPWEDELPETEGGTSLRQTDWYLEGPVDAVTPGEHTLVAVAQTEDGIREAFDARFFTARQTPPGVDG